jgi:hypothetical protein
VECAFGELVMRWGILWRTLQIPLKKCLDIIYVAMLLHNVIVEDRECCEADVEYFRNFDIVMNGTQQALTRQSGEVPRALVIDNNEPRERGRPIQAVIDARMQGQELRNRPTNALAVNNLKRPLQPEMHRNSQGHIYMTN